MNEIYKHKIQPTNFYTGEHNQYANAKYDSG